MIYEVRLNHGCNIYKNVLLHFDHKNGVIIMIRLNRVTCLWVFALYKSLTMITTYSYIQNLIEDVIDFHRIIMII